MINQEVVHLRLVLQERKKKNIQLVEVEKHGQAVK